jgi:hypothetical protein
VAGSIGQGQLGLLELAPGKMWNPPRVPTARTAVADRLQGPPGRAISTVDTQARHARKSKSKRRDGYRGHVAAEPGTGLITGRKLTMAAGPGSADAENGVAMAARDRFCPASDGAEPAAQAGGHRRRCRVRAG